MKGLKWVVVMSLLVFAVVVFSDEKRVAPKFGYPVRVDVLGRVSESPMTIKRVHGPQGRSAGAYFQEATWRDDYKDDFLTCNFPSDDMAWREGWMQFVPSASGKVTLVFRGAWEKDEYGNHVEKWCMIDGVQLEGAIGNNLSFDKFNDKGVPDGWKAAGDAVIKGAGRNGGNAVRVWFQSTVSQEMTVEQDRVVTVRFWYRPLSAGKKTND